MIDIAWNITDESFAGRKDNLPDHELVLQRARDSGVTQFVVCGGSLEDSRKGIELASKLDPDVQCLYITVGVHPTRCNEFKDGISSPSRHLSLLEELIDAAGPRVVGFGEFGLDYEREHFCDRATQQQFFALQLDLVAKLNLPMYLHMRGEGCCVDLLRILREKLAGGGPRAPMRLFPAGDGEGCGERGSPNYVFRGVVHSFTGSLEDLHQILDAGLELGINGCSLKTEENCRVVERIPLDRLHLETDSPYCDIRPTHFSHTHVQTKFLMTKKFELGKMYKSRNEPCRVVEVAEVVAGLKKISVTEVVARATANSKRLFKI